jgi:hypothetical protein
MKKMIVMILVCSKVIDIRTGFHSEGSNPKERRRIPDVSKLEGI